MNEEKNNESPIDWAARLKVEKERALALFGFVYRNRKDGTISREGHWALHQAKLRVYEQAGIVEPQLSGQPERYVGDAVLCTVMAQGTHAGMQALLSVQPELREALEAAVPARGRSL